MSGFNQNYSVTFQNEAVELQLENFGVNKFIQFNEHETVIQNSLQQMYKIPASSQNPYVRFLKLPMPLASQCDIFTNMFFICEVGMC